MSLINFLSKMKHWNLEELDQAAKLKSNCDLAPVFQIVQKIPKSYFLKLISINWPSLVT